jgi:chemotaxis protein methyltransferase CheR
MPSDPSDVETIEIRLLLEAIHVKYGYDLRDYSEHSIRRRVLAALDRSGLGHLGELQHKILTDPEFFGTVLEGLTVQVSDMFRDPGFYNLLRTRVVPLLRTYPFLNVWHSGCATGEEAYSSAIVLYEEGLLDRTQIYATDISAKALEQAKQGVYPEEKLAAFSANYENSGGTSRFASYYTSAYNQVAIKELLRRKILFFQHDLVADHVFGEMHIIFCRNVLIYFRRDLRNRVLEKFSQSLCPGGFLCLGTSERLTHPDHKVFAEFAPEHQTYRYQGA